MSNLVLSIDPGRTTGFALARITDETVRIGYSERKMNHKQFWDFMWDSDSFNIVCESFEYRRQDKVDLYPCELIGILNLWADNNGEEIKYQAPKYAVGKNAPYRDATLKKMGLYFATPHHGRDACRHLLYWLLHGAGYRYIQGFEHYRYELVDVKYLLP